MKAHYLALAILLATNLDCFGQTIASPGTYKCAEILKLKKMRVDPHGNLTPKMITPDLAELAYEYIKVENWIGGFLSAWSTVDFYSKGKQSEAVDKLPPRMWMDFVFNYCEGARAHPGLMLPMASAHAPPCHAAEALLLHRSQPIPSTRMPADGRAKTSDLSFCIPPFAIE